MNRFPVYIRDCGWNLFACVSLRLGARRLIRAGLRILVAAYLLLEANAGVMGVCFTTLVAAYLLLEANAGVMGVCFTTLVAAYLLLKANTAVMGVALYCDVPRACSRPA